MKILSGLTALMLLGAGFTGAAVAAEDNVKIGYVDIRKVVIESKTGQRNKAKLEKMVKDVQAKLQKEEKRLKAMQEKLQKEALTLSAGQKQAKQQEFRQKVQEFQKMANEAQQQVGRKDSEFTKQALADIRAIVAELARDENLLFVFEKDNTPLYAREGPDLTDKVLKRYDAKAGK